MKKKISELILSVYEFSRAAITDYSQTEYIETTVYYPQY